jgi:hypothetical protein
VVDGDGDIAKTYGPRNLSALVIARKVGREKRIVLKWCNEDGAPHDKTKRRGQPNSPSMNLEEIQDWLIAKGLAPVLTDDPARGKGSTEPDQDGDIDLFRERAASFSTDVDYGALIQRMQAQIDTLLARRPPGNAQPDWVRKWAAEVDRLSKELRQLEEAKFDSEKRKGVWIARSVALEMLTAEAKEFTGTLQALSSEVPEQVVLAIMGVIPAGRMDETRRLISTAVRSLFERSRRGLAAAIVASVTPPGEAAA